MSKLRVEGHSGFFKDNETGVITNHSQSDREKYHILKKQALRNIDSEDEIANLKEELGEIKSMLKKLLK